MQKKEAKRLRPLFRCVWNFRYFYSNCPKSGSWTEDNGCNQKLFSQVTKESNLVFVLFGMFPAFIFAIFLSTLNFYSIESCYPHLLLIIQTKKLCCVHLTDLLFRQTLRGMQSLGCLEKERVSLNVTEIADSIRQKDCVIMQILIQRRLPSVSPSQISRLILDPGSKSLLLFKVLESLEVHRNGFRSRAKRVFCF